MRLGHQQTPSWATAVISCACYDNHHTHRQRLTSVTFADIVAAIRVLTKDLPTVAELLRRVAPPVQIAVAVAGLVITVYEGNHLRRHLDRLQVRTAAVLEAKMVHTRDQHKGLAAYLLSQPRLPEAATLPLPKDVEQSLDRIEAAVASSPPPPSVEELIRTLNLKIYRADGADIGSHRTAITGGDAASFLFLPAIALARESGQYPPLTHDQLPIVLTHNPDHLSDLHLARRVTPEFARWKPSILYGKAIKQIYFISQSNILIIRTLGIKDQRGFYSGQFDTHHNFTDRPYFWKAIDGTAVEPIERFNYESEPYIDLGGHGLIRTYSKRLELPNGRFGILALDVEALPEKTLIRQIEERVRVLGGTMGQFEWTTGTGLAPRTTLPDDFSWFAETLDTGEVPEATFLGKIAFARDHQKSGNTDSLLRYTLPLSSTYSNNAKQRTTTLLWIRFDLEKWQKGQLRHILLFSLGALLFLGVGYNVVQDYRILQNQTKELWESMARVMEEAETPFVRLDDDNEWVSANLRFLELVGYKNLDELKRNHSTFRSLLVHRSQHTYDEVLQRSLKGNPTSAYELTVIRRDGSETAVRVHGERAPFPSLWRRRRHPHRFGVILKGQTAGSLDGGNRSQPSGS